MIIKISRSLSRGGGYKANFLRSVIFPIFQEIKTVNTCMISSSYLVGVTTAEPRRHLATMNTIESIWPIFFKIKISRNGENNERSFSNPPSYPPGLLSWEFMSLTTVFTRIWIWMEITFRINMNTAYTVIMAKGNYPFALPVTGEFPAQRPVTRSFDVFFDLRLIIRLSK